MILSHPQQSLNHKEQHGRIQGSSTGLPGGRKAPARPSEADTACVSSQRSGAGINELSVLGLGRHQAGACGLCAR